MTATTNAPIIAKIGAELDVIDLRAIKDENVLDATLANMTKIELAQAWFAVKAPEKAAKDEGEELESLRGKIASRCKAVMVKDELVTIHGNARKRFTVSEYTIENKGKVLDFILLDPSTPEAVKATIRAMLAQDECRTPVCKLGFANPKK